MTIVDSNLCLFYNYMVKISTLFRICNLLNNYYEKYLHFKSHSHTLLFEWVVTDQPFLILVAIPFQKLIEL